MEEKSKKFKNMDNNDNGKSNVSIDIYSDADDNSNLHSFNTIMNLLVIFEDDLFNNEGIEVQNESSELVTVADLTLYTQNVDTSISNDF